MNKIRFSDIPDSIHYSASVDATINSLLSDIVEYVSHNFEGSRKYKTKVVNMINTVVYMIAVGDAFDDNWESTSPFDNLTIVDDKECRNVLGSSYLDILDVVWDIDVVDKDEETNRVKNVFPQIPTYTVVNKHENVKESSKEDLYIQSPTYPRFDTDSIWMSGEVDGSELVIYETLPKVPTKQCEISSTTDVRNMTSKDLLNLYPDRTIQTRYDGLYDSSCGLEYDSILGCILPISNFTKEQVRDNIIKYPHFFKLKKVVDGVNYNFYSTIEIDGELYKTMDIWDMLPEAKVIPRNIDFIKDYVVRRYLLERDILGVDHKYKMYGELEPYLTLFTTVDNYRMFNLGDPVEIARQCVKSRVDYKQSRNPIIRRLSNV